MEDEQIPMKFSDFSLEENLLKGIDYAGYELCMPVQERTFEHTLAQKDVAVQSQTGTGKSAAFLISIYQLLLTGEKFKGQKALIVVPTRELAVQIEKEAKKIGYFLDFRLGTFYGGVGYDAQEKILRGGVDIIIGTPGRLLDFNRSGKLNFEQVSILVIDEADRLFDMGFIPDLQKMIRRMPPVGERLTMLFSATLQDKVKSLAAEYMHEPVEIELTPDQIVVENIDQRIYHVGRHEKMSLLLGIMKNHNPKNALIFTNTKNMAMEVSKRLEMNGFHAEYIIGDLPQKKRLSIIDDFKSGRLPYLIATDVAARGLHVDDLELVVNYDLPEYSENYVHRIGRTARAGKSGKAVSLVCEQFVYGLEDIETYIDMKILVDFADDTMYAEDKSSDMRVSISRDKDRGGRQGARHISITERHRPKGNERPRRDQRAKDPRESRHSIGETPRHKPVERPAEKKPHHSIPKVPKQQNRPPQQPQQQQPQQQQPQLRPKQQAPVKENRKPTGGKNNRGASMDERLKYYSQKYGDNFKIDGMPVAEKKPSLLKRIVKAVNIFKRT